MNKNLVSLDKLYKIIKNNNLDDKITSFGYSKRQFKKYYVILKNNNVIHFGDTRYSDYLLHHDN